MTRSIDVCLSPDLMHLYPVKESVVVVVDVLRATSCMTTAFAHGVECIKAFARLEDCLAMKDQGYLTAGERDGQKVDGFDLGNSPFEYMKPEMKGQRIAFTTTNGTQAITKSIGCRELIIGSFLNLSAVAAHLEKSNAGILIVCSGWKGRICLEDTLFAGALVEKLKDNFALACDSPLAAHHLFLQARNNMMAYLQDSSHVKRLARLNIRKDVAFCLEPDHFTVVPRLVNGELKIS